MKLFRHAKRGADKQVATVGTFSTSRDGAGNVEVKVWLDSDAGLAFKLRGPPAAAETFIHKLAGAAVAFSYDDDRRPGFDPLKARREATAALLRRLAAEVEATQ